MFDNFVDNSAQRFDAEIDWFFNFQRSRLREIIGDLNPTNNPFFVALLVIGRSRGAANCIEPSFEGFL
ncbi:hypothetical protein WJ89_03420 [Burkholderia ubonensis]|nr:hypothetical protein WJ89_03420 [Burkholderia ubonensis]KVP70162.1 hypothetical protein WJ94_30045 [Burkholderia ubonensis]KVR10910.1 hypothetical protein WK12_17685 [Burkholderia ubonensis]KVR50014.1 hypothetical protein WK19_25925 [Burkholderia ubonensis]KVR54361.1 hypothetical protein WK18_31350 [Burkholderia ubonensis]